MSKLFVPTWVAGKVPADMWHDVNSAIGYVLSDTTIINSSVYLPMCLHITRPICIRTGT